MKTLIIITGASRGLGSALARATAGPEVEQLLIARSASALDEVRVGCEQRGATVRVLGADLADASAECAVEAALNALIRSDVACVTLFNNASQVGPIRRLVDVRAEDTTRPIAVNFAAAMWVTSACLRACQAQGVRNVTVVNVSTGVSLKPLIGWSLYCSSKAALNLLTASIAMETADWPTPVRTVALNPGPLDTEMQREIRESSPDQCPDRGRFVGLFDEGRLVPPDAAARKVLSLLNEQPFPQGQFVDLRNR